jgi:hypothetical protein
MDWVENGVYEMTWTLIIIMRPDIRAELSSIFVGNTAPTDTMHLGIPLLVRSVVIFQEESHYGKLVRN